MRRNNKRTNLRLCEGAFFDRRAGTHTNLIDFVKENFYEVY